MDEKTIKAAEAILAKGDRVELIPVKNGVKVVRVRREEISSTEHAAKMQRVSGHTLPTHSEKHDTAVSVTAVSR